MQQKISQNTETQKRIYCVIAVVGTLLAPFVFFQFVLAPFRGNFFTKTVTIATTLPERLAAYGQATTLSAQGIDRRRSILASRTATFIWNLDEISLQQASVFLQDELRLAEHGLLESSTHASRDLRVYLDLGMIYQTWARFFDLEKMENSENVLLESLAQFPRNPLPYWSLVSFYIEMRDFDQALFLSEQALALDSRARTSILRRIITLKLTNQQDKLVQYAQESVKADPSLTDTVQTIMDADAQVYKKELLFHYYYDAAF